MRLARQRHRHQRPAVKRIFKTNHRRPFRVSARNLDSVLHGFCAGIHKHGLLRKFSRRQRIQLFRNGNIALVRRHAEAHMEILLHLLANRVQHACVSVPNVQAADAARKIDEAVAIDVFNYRSFRFRREHRRCMKRSSCHSCIAPVHQHFRFRSRDFRSNLNCSHRRCPSTPNLSTSQSAFRPD